jgi:UDP-N-acetylmuramoyl-L-alanyl-D-glutamate--2,6-diaminopimelate ligase
MPPPSIALHDVATAAPAGARVHGAASTPVADVTHDSRGAGPGVLFACRPGRRADGHDFAPAAVAAGSPALLVERVLDLPVAQVEVPAVADALGPVAAAVHRHPSQELTVLGITGTNGKTTTAFLLEAALAVAGHTTGLLGTVETRVAGERVEGVRTTPEATDLQRLLRRMVDRAVTAVAMEVSSHGLALGRMAGTRVAVAGFTNLTQDHLDFHADLEDYFAAKARLFAPDLAERGVVVVDDDWGARLARAASVPVTTLSLRGHADVTAGDVALHRDGATFRAHLPGRSLPVRIRLPGRFNVANALLALAMLDAAGCDVAAGAAGLERVAGVPGRMERVDAGQPFTVLVDYAHTPEALATVLAAVRDLGGRVLVVIGCGGDRDRAKRPLMGRAAVAGADHAVLTSDNPRSEDPDAIISAMVAGARAVDGGSWTVEPDRARAIAEALAAARPGDVVVIAGKGHERGQELAGRTVPFDDRAVARAVLERLAAGGSA